MRNALVSRDVDLGLDPWRAFYSKVNHGVGKAPLTAYREGEEKNPKLHAKVQRDAPVAATGL